MRFLYLALVASGPSAWTDFSLLLQLYYVLVYYCTHDVKPNKIN